MVVSAVSLCPPSLLRVKPHDGVTRALPDSAGSLALLSSSALCRRSFLFQVGAEIACSNVLSGRGFAEMTNTRSNSPSREDKDRPRFFDAKAKELCWQKADVVPGRHPERWRQDAAGNVVCKRFFNCQGCLCYEYDHIVPYSKGGESTAENCQILQTRVNRFKSDKQQIDKAELEGFSCDLKFSDKELDIIEMAVYGDVIRPGNQCRCRTVAEMLGQYKPKKPMAACELPYKQPS